tara:strand:+ start:44 stop:529 length:486 start_codon:yes stop_codon:yes gene_type:complete
MEHKKEIAMLHEVVNTYKEENKKLKEEIDNQFLGLFGILDDAGYSPTSEGQIVSFVKDIIKENKKLKDRNLYKKLREKNASLQCVCDEFVDVFEKVYTMIDQENLPRYGQTLIYEFQKLKEENDELIKQHEQSDTEYNKIALEIAMLHEVVNALMLLSDDD